MPSSKDILEAQRFNRSRLITAFTSGTPNGREVDTPSPVRPLIFGVVVAVIMCVIGVGTRAEIWNRKAWEQYLSDNEPEYSDIADDVLPDLEF